MFTVLVCLVLVKMIVKRYTGYSIVNTVLPDKFCKFGLAYVGFLPAFSLWFGRAFLRYKALQNTYIN